MLDLKAMCGAGFLATLRICERNLTVTGSGLSVRKIAKALGYSSHVAFNTDINKRGLHHSIECEPNTGFNAIVPNLVLDKD